MERIDSNFTSIEEVGLMLRQKTDKIGVKSVSESHKDRVEAAFKDLLSDDSFKSIVEKTDPDFPEGAYLVFSPHASPEGCLGWISGEFPDSLRLGEDRNPSQAGYKTFMKPHYCLFPSGEIFALVDEEGDYYFF